MEIEVLRLNHRIGRDPRISTHVALTSRAFGCSKIYYSGDKDSKMEETVNQITKKFGGPFYIEYTKEDISLIKEKIKLNYLIIHLTVYGLSIQDEIKNIRKSKKILIIIGGKKVEPQYYKIVNYNLSVTNQPHSELSALAIFLHECFQGKELHKKFSNAKLKVIGKEKGKLLKQL